MSSNRHRILEFDRAKGLAILLVVIGHIGARTPLAGNDWYFVMKGWIYHFHMPFFMFLSGFMLGYTYRPVTTLGDYIEYARGKFLRFMPAFFVVSALIVTGKIVAHRFMYVDNVPADVFGGLLRILIDPINSSASSLWYIYVLYIYCLLFPLVMRITKGYPWLLLLVGALSYAVNFDLTSLLALNRVAEYFIFLVVGVIISRHFELFTRGLDKFGWVALTLFFVLAPFFRVMPFSKLMLGLLSIPALMYFVRLPVINDSDLLLLWGRYVFVIYLFNTVCIGLVKGIGLKIAPWDGSNFFVFFPLLLASGMYLPIALKKWVLVKWPVLVRMTA